MKQGVLVLAGTMLMFYIGVFVTAYYLKYNRFLSDVGDLFGWLL